VRHDGTPGRQLLETSLVLWGSQMADPTINNTALSLALSVHANGALEGGRPIKAEDGTQMATSCSGR